MKSWKTLFGIYQAVVVALTVLFIVKLIPALSLATSVHWRNLFVVALLIVPTILFCFCNAVKLLFPSRQLFQRWKSLTTISIVFAVLWTVLFGYLLIFETDWGKNHTSAPRTDSSRIGQEAPDFVAKDQFGQTISLSKLKGKVVLLDFWGTWCGACLQKLPYTQKLHDKYKAQGLVVIGIHSEHKAKSVSTFLAGHNYTFPICIDTGGDIANDYSVAAWPTYYLIDEKGDLVWGPEHKTPPRRLIGSLLGNRS